MILTTCVGFIGLRNPGRSLSRRRDSRDKQAGRSHAIGTSGQVGVEVNDTRIRERYGTVADYGPDCIGQIRSKESFAWSFRCIGGFQTILVLFMFILGRLILEISNRRYSSCHHLGVPQSVCCQAFRSYSLSASVPIENRSGRGSGYSCVVTDCRNHCRRWMPGGDGMRNLGLIDQGALSSD
jgi:hypothetical protein